VHGSRAAWGLLDGWVGRHHCVRGTRLRQPNPSANVPAVQRSVDYDQVAPSYDRRYETSDYSGITRALNDFVTADGPLRVLEVGCGTGHWLALLSERGHAVAGLDASQQMLEIARTRAPGAKLVRGGADHLPWDAASFDRVVCINAFHHFTAPQAFIAEARRVLRPRGALMTIGLDPHTGLDEWCIYRYFAGTLETDLLRYAPTAQIRAWLSDAGFSDCRTEVAQHIPLRVEAREALASGRLAKTATSQLSVLTDTEYDAGIAHIAQAIDTAEQRGERLYLSGDLRLYATFGHVVTTS
jgi:ubiquinone/menaquinone biosynthesis C-methylase UbiE